MFGILKYAYLHPLLFPYNLFQPTKYILIIDMDFYFSKLTKVDYSEKAMLKGER